MATLAHVGVNPLPWVLTPNGFDLSVATLSVALPALAAAGFGAIHADVPAGMSVAAYREMLADHGLVPAPGYFAAHFDDASTLGETVEAARRHAAGQAELGLTEAFFASHLNPARMATPAVGAAFDKDTLALVVEQMGVVAAVITAEGVTPCLHPHVGSWVETEHEVRAVLDGVDPGHLAFGPDTGHLFWAGIDPVAITRDYADRVAAVHLKDVHRVAAAQAAARGADYMTSVYDEHVWTEPGKGEVPFEAFLAALPTAFDGWFVVEVDNPDRITKEESAAVSAQWVTQHQTQPAGRP